MDGSFERARVLIVDDDEVSCLLTETSLAQSGFDTEVANNGETALELFKTNMPDAVLLDVNMPGMDGFTVCSMMQAHPEGERIPILMLTGLDDVASISRAFELGATDFITKPINWTILGHRVQYALRASRAIDELKRSQKRLTNAQRIAGIGDWELDVKKNELYLSDQVFHIFGLPRTSQPVPLDSFLKSVHRDDVERVRHTIERAVAEGKPCQLEHRILRPGGVQRVVYQQGEVTRFGPAGEAIRMVGTTQDITRRKRAEEHIRQLAYYDQLTALPNRLLFVEHLSAVLDEAKRSGRQVAAMFLDLDQFKRINDTLGHALGDQLLHAAGQRLLRSVRGGDAVGRLDADAARQVGSATIARLGGDEFTLLLADVQQPEDAASVAQRILDTLAQPLSLGCHEICISASIGIALFPADGKDVDTLLMNADAAMYYAKEQGRNNFQFYDKSMNARALEKLSLESSLRKAVERNEFILHYQPRVDIGTGRIVGTEALLRWNHPERGLVPPAEFIPLAEETGLIVPIGEWAVAAACKQSRAWQDMGLPPVPVAVNISSLHFRRGNLVETVRHALRDSRLESGQLELEVTESVLMQDLQSNLDVLRMLTAMGVNLAVDDFGTGYSSLSYLKRLPLDAIKIDKSFVLDIAHDPDDAAITAAVIAMAHSLKLKVVAEGVENAQQLAFLVRHGCDEYQGHHFSGAVSAGEVVALFEAQTRTAGEGTELQSLPAR